MCDLMRTFEMGTLFLSNEWMNQSNAISVSFARELIHSKRFVMVVCIFQANVYLHWKSMIGNDHWSSIGYLMMNSFNENEKQHSYLHQKKRTVKMGKRVKSWPTYGLIVFPTEMIENQLFSHMNSTLNYTDFEKNRFICLFFWMRTSISNLSW